MRMIDFVATFIRTLTLNCTIFVLSNKIITIRQEMEKQLFFQMVFFLFFNNLKSEGGMTFCVNKKVVGRVFVEKNEQFIISCPMIATNN